MFDFASIDVSNVEASEPRTYGPVPAGDYTAVVVDVEPKITKKGGEMLSIKHEIVEGEHKGQWIWGNINIVNSNPTAVQIGMETLKALYAATGNGNRVETASQLYNVPLTLSVKISPANGDYAARNDVAGYKKKGNAPAASATPAATTPPAGNAAITSADVPW